VQFLKIPLVSMFLCGKETPMSRTPGRLLFQTMALLALGASLVQSAAATEPPAATTSPPAEAFSLAACVDAWRNRALSSKYLRFSWTQTETIASGMLPVPGRLAVQFGAAAPHQMPLTDTTLTGKYGLLFSGSDGRFEEDGVVFSPDRNRAYRRHDIRIFANARYIGWTEKNDITRHGIGEIQPPSRSQGIVRERNIVPLAIFFRILDPQYGQFASDKIDVEPNPIVIDGHRCRVLRRTISKSLTSQLCVDAERAYIPLRYTFSVDGHAESEWSVTKVWSRAGGLFAPAEWRMSRFRTDGKLISELRGTATSCLVPTKMSSSEFELEFRAGTWVFDNIARRQYVVQVSGFRRAVPKGAGEAQYDWLMNPANNDRSPAAGR
jgi:hypothetical protein